MAPLRLRLRPHLSTLVPLLAWLALAPVAAHASFVPVTNAAELKACMEDPATPLCELTQPILFTGNETSQFLEINAPNDAVSFLRCAPGASIVWDNADGPPEFGVNVVRLTLTGREQVVVQDCHFETRVNGDSEVGQDASVQLLFARHVPVAIDTLSTVAILGGSYKTAHYGGSTIALGCNCTGPTEWILADTVVEGPIALDAKGNTPDGSPLDWTLLNTQLIARTPASGDSRCWKQKGDVRFKEMAGSSCSGGMLAFSSGTNPHMHDLDGFTIRDAPGAGVLSAALIWASTPQGFEGTIRVEGAPGDGDPADNRTHNLIAAGNGLQEVDLEVEFDSCHRAFSPDAGMGDFALDLRPGDVDEQRVYLRGPAGCGNPTEFWNGTTLQTLADSETDGYLLTNGGISFELVDGVPVPEPGVGIGLGAGLTLLAGLARRSRGK